MSGELEAAGALATAGLAAGAIEGRGPHGGDHGGTCINCGAEITGPFCAQCGQASHPHRSLTHVVEEFLHGVLHFDTKAWRTLPMVIFRPGTLTRNYVYGKRARYISPLALFLFTIFFMFCLPAVLALVCLAWYASYRASLPVAAARDAAARCAAEDRAIRLIPHGTGDIDDIQESINQIARSRATPKDKRVVIKV